MPDAAENSESVRIRTSEDHKNKCTRLKARKLVTYGKDTRSGVLELEVLIGELSPIDRFA